MSTLILYSSREGFTKKIAEYISLKIENSEVYNIDTFDSNKLDSFDKVIVGASIHYGHFARKFIKFINYNSNLLNKKCTAFYSVNLTARKIDKNTPETNVYTSKFLRKTIWKPNIVKVFAGALNYSKLNFFDRNIIRFIMFVTNGDTSLSTNKEYLDWNLVDKFINEFNSL